MKLLVTSIIAGTAAAFAPTSSVTGSSSNPKTVLSETKTDLEDLALKLNPYIPRYDPIGLADYNLWGTSESETIGFIREAEVKHGRIAMLAFVGYIVHANGITWSGSMMLDGTPFPKVSNAPEAWDAIPDSAKLQIFAFVGFLEVYREVTGTHYMKGGKIGEYPDFDSKVIPGGALNLYDPFGWSRKRTEEEKAEGLIKELNNGRLAMLGIMGFVSEGKIEGSVPALRGIIPHYDGEIMAPLSKSILPSIPDLF
jgi:hypothetical protein